jgi:hypothetical protein
MQVGFCTCTGAKLKMMRGRASIGAMMALPSTGLKVFLTFCFIFVLLRIESYLLPNKNVTLFYSIIVICYLYILFLRSSVLDPDPDPSNPSPSKKVRKT